MLRMRSTPMRRKRILFFCGLDPELRTMVGVEVYPDFNTMVNRAITTTKNRQDKMRNRQRKLEAKKTYS
jgi:hypothetical protein